MDYFEPESYLIRQLETYNWGPFTGLHRFEIDPEGTAIIGQTGSGKTTLVDALTTLLVERPLYNLASTGGHESDRDLLSYVRGVVGAGNDSGDNAHIARPGATVTGLGLCIASESDSIFLGALMAVDSGSSAVADLRRVWIFDHNPEQSLADWLQLHHEGSFRAVRHFARNADAITALESKRAYLTRVRRFFAVGDSAFDLLNRAAGLKQLNSIDELFRELVLDDQSAYRRAAEVIGAFDDLKAIHAELEIARQQQDSLQLIEREHRRWRRHDQAYQSYLTQKEILPLWYASHAITLWSERGSELQRKISVAVAQEESLKQQLETVRARVEELHRAYIESGGGSIEDLRQQILQQGQIVERIERAAADYQRICRAQGWSEDITSSQYASNQSRAVETVVQIDAEIENGATALERLTATVVEREQKAARLEGDLAAVKSSPGSNIPTEFQRFKNALADAVRQPVDEITYVAELVEVLAEQKVWRGAIERAIGAHRLRLVVPPEATRAALDWVNGRHNRLHVRLLDESSYPGDSRFLDDGFCRKLAFKTHPRREAVKRLLANIDLHCVVDAQTLERTPRAMTQQGLMSRRSGVFDKQDQRALDDNWMTGFDNKDLLDRLAGGLNEAKREATTARRDYESAQRQKNEQQQKKFQLEQFVQLTFEEVDTSPLLEQLTTLRGRLDTLLDPASDTAKAEQIWRAARGEEQSIQERLTRNAANMQTDRSFLERAELQLSAARQRHGEGLTVEQKTIGEAAFTIPDIDNIDHLDELERDAARSVQQHLDDAIIARASCETELGRQMERAQRVDTGALAEVGTELQDVDAYLERLRILSREALPEKQQRFLAYLNRSSDEGVTQLLRSIEAEVAKIEERIDEINHTMKKVDFAHGQYLRLEPAKLVHERIRTLQRAQKQLQSASLVDDMGESHFQALNVVINILKEAVDNPRRQAARALLDPRYRLRFSVSVVERDSERIIENRTGSQGGSGGEKEIIASYILTASLSYALCPDGATKPLFGTVILDEAFSKSSMTVASRIIGALRQFGLHPLFVTPNKEMRLLRAHTRSAILVHRTGNQSVSTSLSWEELDAHHRDHLATRREISR